MRPKSLAVILLLISLSAVVSGTTSRGNKNRRSQEEEGSADADEQPILVLPPKEKDAQGDAPQEEDDDGPLHNPKEDGGKLKFKFVNLDKNVIFSSFQQSPVDPIGATTGFRGSVGRRVTESPGEWAYRDEVELVIGGGDDDHVAAGDGIDLEKKREALNHYRQGIQILYPPPQQPQTQTQPPKSADEPPPAPPSPPEQKQPSPSFTSTSVFIRTSVGKTPQITSAYRHFNYASEYHHESRELVAYAHLLGHHGLPFSIQTAHDMLQNLSALGYPNSQFALGLLSSYGLAMKLDASLSLLHYTFGAISGSAFSSMAMGYRYWGGIGVQASCERALEQYRTVASIVASEVSEAGVGPAIQRVRLLDEFEGEQRGGAGGSGGSGSAGNVLNSDILDYYTMLAERGDVQAQVGLGQLHFQGGRGISPDHHLALRYFQRAADAGSPVAMAFLGKMYLEGNDAVEPDYNMALRWFQRAAEQGSPVGQSGLGLMYLNGKGLPRDPSRALQYFTMAAEQGWVDGQLQLGNMYVSGIGVRRDYNLAAKYYNLAAQSGHILAIYNLAQMHATGTGMMRSCTAAVELYKSVAERGRWGLLLSEAYTHYQDKRYSNALMIYLLLSELGYEAAQSNAAFMLERGEIGEQVYSMLNGSNVTPEGMLSKALQQWGRSASQGYSPARVRLGDYYYYGWGTGRDYGNAATQYRVASETNRNAQAMFNLAYMHENGLGLKQDLHLAKRFYDMAAETSNDARVPVALALVKLQFLSYFKGVGLLGGSGGEEIVTTEDVVVSGNERGFFESFESKQQQDKESAKESDHNNPHHHYERTRKSREGDPDEDSLQFDEYWDLYLITVLIGLLGLLLYGRHDRRVRNANNNNNNGGGGGEGR